MQLLVNGIVHTIKPTDVFTLSGTEFMTQQTELDSIKEAYEDAAVTNKQIPLLQSTIKSLHTKLAKEQAFNSTILKQYAMIKPKQLAYANCTSELTRSNEVRTLAQDLSEQYRTECNRLTTELKEAYLIIDSLRKDIYA